MRQGNKETRRQGDKEIVCSSPCHPVSLSPCHPSDRVQVKYPRILLKLSGERLSGENGYGIDPEVVRSIAKEIGDVRSEGIDVGVVLGGGNIFRGAVGSALGMERASADYMGMLGTVMNSLALQDALEKIDVDTRVQTAIHMESVAEPYIRRRAIRHMEKGRVVIFGAGTGNPYFTTDTAAALRAIEIDANVLLKGTKVDGVYDADPELHPTARKFIGLRYIDVLEGRLKVMDATAISLCMDNELPIVVFSIKQSGNLLKAAKGDPIGTLIKEEQE